MCGRYTLHLSRLEALADLLGLERGALTIEATLEAWVPRYNVAPSQSVPVLRRGRAGHVLAAQQWGLLPAWATEVKPNVQSRRPINARIETVATLPTFREAFARHRVVVPATGYFEWRVAQGHEGARKEPLWIHPRDGGVMAFAGVSDQWTGRDGEVLDSFAIVTMEPSAEIAAIHDRMPVELRGEDIKRWLDPQAIDASTLDAIATRSGHTDHLGYHAVAPAMGSPRIDEPACIEPAREARAQLDLFDAGKLGASKLGAESSRD